MRIYQARLAVDGVRDDADLDRGDADRGGRDARVRDDRGGHLRAVSYTHLTLPTKA